MMLAPGASYLAKYNVWCHKKDQIMMIIAPGASYGQAYSGSYDAGTASNYAVSKRSARSLPQVSSSGFAQIDGIRVFLLLSVKSRFSGRAQ